MKKFFALIAALLLLCSLTACGSSAAPAAPAAAEDCAACEEESFDYYTAADSANGAWTAAESPVKAPQEQGSKIIYTAQLELQTLEFDKALADIAAATNRVGGYFASTSTSGRGSGYRYADYTVKVPADQLDSFLTQIGEVCHVAYSSTSAEDISDTYYDTESRLKTAQTKLERLQELLAKANNMEDIITIESAISDTEWTIENLSGTLRGYDSLVAYSTVYLSLSEVYKLSGTDDAPVTFLQRIRTSFTRGLQSVGQFFENLVVWLAYSWFWLLIIVVIAAVAIRIIRKKKGIVRRFKKKSAELTETTQQDNP